MSYRWRLYIMYERYIYPYWSGKRLSLDFFSGADRSNCHGHWFHTRITFANLISMSVSTPSIVWWCTHDPGWGFLLHWTLFICVIKVYHSRKVTMNWGGVVVTSRTSRTCLLHACNVVWRSFLGEGTRERPYIVVVRVTKTSQRPHKDLTRLSSRRLNWDVKSPDSSVSSHLSSHLDLSHSHALPQCR